MIDHDAVQVDRAGDSAALKATSAWEMNVTASATTMPTGGSGAWSGGAAGRRHRPSGPNLEYLASVVATGEQNGASVLYPDSVLGTDSHTP